MRLPFTFHLNYYNYELVLRKQHLHADWQDHETENILFILEMGFVQHLNEVILRNA